MIIKTTQRHLLSCLLSLIFFTKYGCDKFGPFSRLFTRQGWSRICRLGDLQRPFHSTNFQEASSTTMDDLLVRQDIIIIIIIMIIIIIITDNIVIFTECPLHTQIFKQKDIFNWTATYRGDSTIVAPYERFFLFLWNFYFYDSMSQYHRFHPDVMLKT